MFSIRGTFKFPSINWLRLYVRSTEAERKTAIDIRGVRSLFVVVENFPEALQISAGGKQPVLLALDEPGAIGLNYNFNNPKKLRVPIFDIELTELSKRALRSYESSDESKDPHELFSLLGRLFPKAAASACSLPETAEAEECRSIYWYIIALTQRSKAQADLYRQASTLLRRLELPTEAKFYVPRPSPADCKKAVDAWFATAITINRTYSDADLQSLIQDKLKETLTNVISTQIKFAEQDSRFDIVSLHKKAEAALQSVKAAQIEFKALETRTEEETEAFQAEVKAYRKREETKARGAILITCVEVVAAIGIAAYTFGAATPKVAEAAGKLKAGAEKLKEVAKKAEGVKSKVDLIKDIVAKIGKMHEFAEKVRLWNQKRGIKPDDPVKRVAALAKGMKADKVPPTAFDTFDFFALKTQWDDFALDNEETFTALLKIVPAIPRIREYHLCIKKTIVPARSLIAAQAEAHSAQDKYMRAELYTDLLNRRKEEYEDPAKFKTADAVTAQALKAYLADEKTVFSRWLFLSIHEWILARIHAAGLSSFPVQLTMDQNLIDYQATVARFETKLNSIKPTGPQQVKTPLAFSSTDKNSIFEME
ncbi:hypothetical protein H2199_002519 [Coniosporium tulheliwenetii]|uniref:Uncharacterized protein n=1 Tax=Coniosporium tulheliwenetii TaxID=3383036 RepID=A0ACC2ZFB3_9PEZI|nr:hypothetical protein H2199_002519 [Cladosporium sp. JES 115]